MSEVTRRLLPANAVACLTLAALLSVPSPELRRSGLLILPLVTESSLAQIPPRVLPEAPDLRALFFVATGVTFSTGVLEILGSSAYRWWPAGSVTC